MSDFEIVLIEAQKGDKKRQEELLMMYRPLLIRQSIVNDVFDEDLYQELCCKFILCIIKFKI